MCLKYCLKKFYTNFETLEVLTKSSLLQEIEKVEY